MGTKKWVFLVLIVAVLGLACYFLLWTPTVPEVEPVAQVPVPQVPAPIQSLPPAEPVERYPIDSSAASVEQSALPVLHESDGMFRDALSKLFGQKVLATYFYPDRMIRRFVASIDNLPRKEAPARVMPVKPVGGPFLVKQSETGMIVDPANARRYVRYLDVMAAVDARRLVDLYIQLYPLCQQAYRELGFPKGYFNDRLIQTLDDLLAAPNIVPPVVLLQPKVLYEFADPTLEALSAGQKIMLRMGPENMARAKLILRAIRSELLSRSPAR